MQYLMCVVIQSSNENGTQTHGKINGLTFPHTVLYEAFN